MFRGAYLNQWHSEYVCGVLKQVLRNQSVFPGTRTPLDSSAVEVVEESRCLDPVWKGALKANAGLILTVHWLGYTGLRVSSTF